MGNFDNAIPRGTVPISHEGSLLHSPREPGGAGYDWKRTEAANHRNDTVTRSLSQIQRQVAKLGKTTNAISQLYPFKLYQFPSYMRYFHPIDEAYRIKVRSGCILGSDTSMSASTPCPGTDFQAGYAAQLPMPEDIEIYTSGSIIPPNDASAITSTWNEAIVPQDGNIYYFWITTLASYAFPSFSGGPIVVAFGASPTTSIELSTGTAVSGSNDLWPTFPADDPYHIMIGAATVANPIDVIGGTPILQIFQSLRQDINFGFGMNGADGSIASTSSVNTRFRGTYSSGTYYFVGDVVLEAVSTGASGLVNTYILWPPSGTAYPIYQGPIKNIDPLTHSADPWLLIGQSITSASGGGTLQSGPFDGTKNFLRQS